MGEHHVGLTLAVVAQILHGGVADAGAALVDGIDVDGGLADDGALVVEEVEVECVVALIEARANPVEVHQFAIFVLVEDEACREHGALEVGVEGYTRVQPRLVETQFVVAAHQQHILQVTPLAYIEALEGRVAQLQQVSLVPIFAGRVGIAHPVLQAVALVVELSAGVELEGVKLVVVPVGHVVFEVDGICLVARLPHAYADRVLLPHDVEEEVAADGDGLRTADGVFHLHVVAVGAVGAVVDAEAEQAVVAHAPELPLLGLIFHVGRGKHLFHGVHLDDVAGYLLVFHLSPVKS